MKQTVGNVSPSADLHWKGACPECGGGWGAVAVGKAVRRVGQNGPERWLLLLTVVGRAVGERESAERSQIRPTEEVGGFALFSHL